MAYYNDVRILMSVKAFELFKSLVEYKCVAEDVDNPLEKLDTMVINKEQDSAYFGWNYIKWFNDWCKPYNIISSVLNLIVEKGYSYQLSRIGEGYDDIEVICEGEADFETDIPIVRKFNDSVFVDEKGN